jgi:hypothetical protein
MQKNYNDWMSESVKELTPAGRIKRPSYETVVDWVSRSWNAIDISLIQRSFKCCGISNKRDGTEDNLIFDYERLGQVKSSDEIEILDDDKNGDDGSNNINDDYYDREKRDYDNEWDN